MANAAHSDKRRKDSQKDHPDRPHKEDLSRNVLFWARGNGGGLFPHQMHVEMEDVLAASSFHIKNEFIPGVGD
jgi:hypothetical protein